MTSTTTSGAAETNEAAEDAVWDSMGPEMRDQWRAASMSLQLAILYGGRLHAQPFMKQGEAGVCYCDICKAPSSIAVIKREICDETWDMCLACAAKLVEKLQQCSAVDSHFEPVGMLATVTKTAVEFGVNITQVRAAARANSTFENDLVAAGVVNGAAVTAAILRFKEEMNAMGESVPDEEQEVETD